VIVHIFVQYAFFAYSVLIKGRISEYSIFEALVPELQPSETSEDLLVDVKGFIVVALVIGLISFDLSVIGNKNDRPNVS
jgi:multisubunit Na+/H+ antiporter MnhB subunit